MRYWLTKLSDFLDEIDPHSPRNILRSLGIPEDPMEYQRQLNARAKVVMEAEITRRVPHI